MALYHSAKGSVNYTVVGSPTIVDGIASGFSADNYFTLGFLPETDVTKYVYSAKFTLGTLGATQAVLSYRAGGPGGITITADGHIRYDVARYVEATGSTFSVTSTNAYQEGETISAEGFYKGNNTFGLVIKNASGVVIENVENTVRSNRTLQPIQVNDTGYYTSIGRLYPSGTSVWYCKGSIDINETYIKVNGQPWFGVCPVEVKKHQLKGPVGYTVVGSPTIVDGVMTYSNVSNYVRTRQNFLSSYNDYEIVCKCAKRLSTEEIIYCMSSGNNGTLQARLLSNAFRFMPYTFSNYIEIQGTFATDVWYWFKVRRTGNTIYASYSTDGVSWSNEVSKTFEQLTTESDYIAFGARITGGANWNGTSIDLNETYIKVNGKLWFYQPADTKYIVKDGKLVWADPRIYIDDNGTTTYATQNIAPVPAGFTFGTTTTPSIGYVDMRTQVFTAAPQGATIGREE